MKPPLTPEQRADIVRRYRKGQSVRFVAFAVDRDARVVSRILKEEGAVLRPRVQNRNWGWKGGFAP